MSARPENIGVLALEIYFPTRYVAQTELEAVDNCKGKYTSGLGQLNMAFTDDREDIGSIYLTVTSNLLAKYGISPDEIGRVEVGTETLVDKSKSAKTLLMRFFGDNTDIEGVTSVNACYGGTAALFNSIAWMESSEWNGKFALVVCGDIAVYDVGPARPTGGCGAVAILIGPNAPLAIENGVRSSHALDVYDFYKPNHSEYPTVDGKLSQWAYLSSVDNCYERYKAKYLAKYNVKVNLGHFDFFAFHSPYNKLVQKGFNRLVYCDFLEEAATGNLSSAFAHMSQLIDVKREDSYDSRDVETAVRVVADPIFREKVSPACVVNQNIGNIYTGSVFASLLSVVCKFGDDLKDKRIFMFSYGSGSVASIYSFVGRELPADSRFTLGRIQSTVNVFERLEQRRQCSFEEFTNALALRAEKYGKAPMNPSAGLDNISAGSYYLVEVDSLHRRVYAQV